MLFRYPPRSAAALSGGTLPLRYCPGKFASKVPTWLLPADGHVLGLVPHGCAVLAAPGAVGDARVNWVRGSWRRRKKSPTKQKNSSTPCYAWHFGDSGSTKVWKRLGVLERSGFGLPGAKVGRVHQSDGDYAPGMDREGIC